MVESKLIHIRLPSELVKRLDYITAEHDLYRTELIELLLELAIENIEKKEWDMEKLVLEFFEESEEEDEE